MKLSVVVPAYNESNSITTALPVIVSAAEELTRNFEVVVVDDGSCDETARLARMCAELYPRRIKVVELPVNCGKGAAIVHGAMHASGERIAFLDADLDLHPSLLHAMNAQMDASGADVVIGSKRHPHSDVQIPRVRRVLSAGYFFLVKALFGMPLRDTQTGIKIFKRDVLKPVLSRLLVKRFAFDLELLVSVCRTGGRIEDAPVTIRSQRLAQRIRFRDVKTIFLDTLAVFYRARIRRWYDTDPQFPRPTYGFTPVVSYGRATPRAEHAAAAAGQFVADDASRMSA